MGVNLQMNRCFVGKLRSRKAGDQICLAATPPIDRLRLNALFDTLKLC